MKQPKKNLFSQSIDLDVDHVESNLKQSTKILQEMKENLAKEVKDYFFSLKYLQFVQAEGI